MVDISIKKVTAPILLALFLSGVMVGPASGALLSTWVPSIHTASRLSSGASAPSQDFDVAVAQLNADLLKFEGLLAAYSAGGDDALEEQILFASDNISASLKAFNTVLSESYPDLNEDQQLAVSDAYTSLGSYLEDLADEANQILIGDKESTPIFIVNEDIEIIIGNATGRLWVGSVSAQ